MSRLTLRSNYLTGWQVWLPTGLRTILEREHRPLQSTLENRNEVLTNSAP